MNLQIEGGYSIQMKKEHTAHVSFVNTLGKTLSGAVLAVKGSGLLAGKHEAKWVKAGAGKKTPKQNILLLVCWACSVDRGVASPGVTFLWALCKCSLNAAGKKSGLWVKVLKECAAGMLSGAPLQQEWNVLSHLSVVKWTQCGSANIYYIWPLFFFFP